MKCLIWQRYLSYLTGFFFFEFFISPNSTALFLASWRQLLFPIWPLLFLILSRVTLTTPINKRGCVHQSCKAAAVTEFADDDYLLNISDGQKRSSRGNFKEKSPWSIHTLFWQLPIEYNILNTCLRQEGEGVHTYMRTINFILTRGASL